MRTILHRTVYPVFIFFLLIVMCQHSIAQVNADSITYYFDRDLNFCSPDKMTFIGFGKKEDGLFRLSLFTVGDAKLAMTGYYTDSTLKVREGEFNNYDATGHKTSFEHYHRDTIYGYAVWLTNDYLCRDSILYENGVDVWRATYSYLRGNKYNKVMNDTRTGAKDLTTYFEDGSIKTFAHWIQGTGDQTTYFPNSSKIESITSYTKNKMTGERHFNEEGTEIPLAVYRQQQQGAFEELENAVPSYPDGLQALAQYIGDNMRRSWSNSFYGTENMSGNRYTLVFMVNKKGKAYDLKVKEIANEDNPLYRRLKQVLGDAPKWDMKGHESFGPVTITISLYGN